MSREHEHEHEHERAHGHDHDHRPKSTAVLLIALVFTLTFAFVEAIAGWWAGSLALMSDAGHMVTDSAALGIGALAAWLALRPPSRRHSYGLQRAEVLGALVNGLLMAAVVGSIFIAAWQRLLEPGEVRGGVVMGVAAIGLAINIAVAWILHRGEQNMNVRGAMLHVMGDLLGSVAALIAGAVIHFTAWTPIDPLLSLLIALLISASAWRLMRDVTIVLMEAVPRHVDFEAVGQALARIQGVSEVHDLHVWSLASRETALSAHLVIDSMERWPVIMAVARDTLARDFEIRHTTLQPELHERVTLVPVEQMGA